MTSPSTVVMIIANGILGSEIGKISKEFETDRAITTPAGWTFSIWGLIYLLLLVQKNGIDDRDYVLSCIFNVVWLISWTKLRNKYLSAAALLALTVCLLRLQKRYPDEIVFSVYSAWCIVATILNLSLALNIAPSSKTIQVLLPLLATITVPQLYGKTTPYHALVGLWASTGILSKLYYEAS